MADIDQIIAGGAGSSSRADFSGIPKILDYFYKSKDEAAKNDLRDAFKGGVPTTSDGQPDFAAMAKTLFQKGGLSEGTAAANLGLAQQNQRFGQEQSTGIQRFESGQQPIVSPTTSRNTVTIDPSKRADISPPAAQPQAPEQPTVMKILAAQGIPNDQLGAASASISRQLGIDPTAPIDVNDPRIRNVLAPAVAQLKRMGIGQVAPPGTPQQQPIPQVGQQPPQQLAPQGQPAPVTNSVTTTQAPQTPSRSDQAIALYSGIMSDPRSPKQNVELAKTRLEAFQKNAEFTPDQKNYIQYKLEGGQGTMQDFLTEQESGKSAATERAKADVGEQQEYIKSGKMASDRLTTLNTISNIIGSDKMTLGFGADTALKVQMALKQLGVDVGDLSGPQAITKLNSILASESSKSFSSRPTQFEFKTFLANNPGLSMDKAGNERVIGIYSQLAKREIDLGRLARQNQDNWSNWDNVVEKYDKTHPIKDPNSGRAITTNSIVAPGPRQGGPAATPQKFSSPGDVHAAIAAGKLQKGDSFVDNNGKTRVVP
jgi:hypothetical protein